MNVDFCNLFILGFLEKNRDTFHYDLRQLIQQCDNIFLQNLFKESNTDINQRSGLTTLSYQFRTSVDNLMKTLGACHPFFIRCIKPNEHKKPMVRFNLLHVTSGVFENYFRVLFYLFTSFYTFLVYL